MAGRTVTITGIRDLARTSEATVDMAIARLLASHPTEIRFGGARGTDTVALAAACEMRAHPTRLVVYCPATASALSHRSAQWVAECADEVIELGYPPAAKWAYLRRNEKMLDGADLLLAFTDRRTTGGTAYTIAAARLRGIEVEVIDVEADGATRHNPDLTARYGASAAIHGVRPYVSAIRGADAASEAVRRLKVGAGTADDVDLLSEILASYILADPSLRAAHYLVPMPRSRPSVPSDMLPVVVAAAQLTAQMPLADWLLRTSAPVGGYVAHRRMRHRADEHSDSMAVAGLPIAAESGVLLVDNVVTTGGTAIGAQRAVRRDTGADVPVIALLYAAS